MGEGILCSWEEERKKSGWRNRTDMHVVFVPEKNTPPSSSGTLCIEDMILLLSKYVETVL
jgi:hypothetical protein